MKKIHEISRAILIVSALISLFWLIYHMGVIAVYGEGIISEPNRALAITEVCFLVLLLSNVFLYIATIRR
jgi:hypothetical protein